MNVFTDLHEAQPIAYFSSGQVDMEARVAGMEPVEPVATLCEHTDNYNYPYTILFWQFL